MESSTLTQCNITTEWRIHYIHCHHVPLTTKCRMESTYNIIAVNGHSWMYRALHSYPHFNEQLWNCGWVVPKKHYHFVNHQTTQFVVCIIEIMILAFVVNLFHHCKWCAWIWSIQFIFSLSFTSMLFNCFMQMLESMVIGQTLDPCFQGRTGTK